MIVSGSRDPLDPRDCARIGDPARDRDEWRSRSGAAHEARGSARGSLFDASARTLARVRCGTRSGSGGPASAETARRGRRRDAVRLLVALRRLFALPDLVQSQSAPKLVSNTGQVQSGFSSSFHLAQQFTTGANARGYILDSVGLRLESIQTDTSLTYVTIREDDSGDPTGDVVASLSNPSVFTASALNTFSAPSSTRLAVNTKYWVVVNEERSSASEGIEVSTTDSDNEDSDSAAGWSIADTQTRKQPSDTAWTTVVSTSVRIELHGYTVATNVIATGAPEISGVPQVGKVLTADLGTIADGNGLPMTFPDHYTFQWVRNFGGLDQDISGATSSTYTVSAGDVGAKIKVEVGFTDNTGRDEKRASDLYPQDEVAVSDEYPGQRSVVAAPGACPDSAFYCGIMTVGENYESGHEHNNITIGFASEKYGLIDGVDSPRYQYNGENYGINELYLNFEHLNQPRSWHLYLDTRIFDMATFTFTKLPIGYELRLEDRQYFFNSETADGGDDTGRYQFFDIEGLNWFVGQDVRVSLLNVDYAPTFDDGDRTTRDIAEDFGNTSRGSRPVGRPVSATDLNSDQLVYSLLGGDTRKFQIDSNTGQISTRPGEIIDYEDRGSYSVVVQVYDGNFYAFTTVEIRIQDLPEQPLTLDAPTVEADGPSKLSVSWTARDNTGIPQITGYDLQYLEHGEWVWHEGPQGVSGTSATLNGLNRGQTYQVQVRAVNAEGVSQWSASGTAQTSKTGEVTPTVRFDKSSYSVYENANVWITVNLTRRLDESVTIPLRVTHLGGASSRDYTGVPNSITFGARQNSKSFALYARDDASDEGESLRISFGDLPDGVESSGPSSTTITFSERWTGFGNSSERLNQDDRLPFANSPTLGTPGPANPQSFVPNTGTPLGKLLDQLFRDLSNDRSLRDRLTN